MEVNDANKSWIDSNHRYHPRKGADITNLPCKIISIRCLAYNIFEKYVARKRAKRGRALDVCRFLKEDMQTNTP